ncbi:MAG TPA: hypothetical protein VK135_03020 [Candidatus Dormibacteraeota bacterium]|nr:hypothetical protein [Candidatus Dormibacteraeota bacterium]
MGQFSISEEAAKWFKEEMGLDSGDYVQFFVKIYGGIPTAHPNYFLGVSVGESSDISVKQEVDGITFFFNERDSWFLDEFNMSVVKDENKEEVDYIFE